MAAAYALTGGDPVTGREVARRAAAGDATARQVVDRAGAALGAALARLVALLDPDAVVVAGGAAATVLPAATAAYRAGATRRLGARAAASRGAGRRRGGGRRRPARHRTDPPRRRNKHVSVLDELAGGLVVSCQPLPDGPDAPCATRTSRPAWPPPWSAAAGGGPGQRPRRRAGGTPPSTCR
ncbi:ROK family protein [Micromonospora sp. BRA006-A]|nr:ROK family protein [Micromonospora sp. BRA006-A]